MFIDDEGQVFNPFSVGPASDNQRYEYKMPEAPTYPPPVFATWPPPKQHTNRSVSQGSLVKKAASDINSVKSKMGQVAISNAINKEMAASKQLSDDEERFNAGRDSKTHVPKIRAMDNKSHMSVTTLMPVRERRSSSKTSLKSHVSNVSKSVSGKSNQSAAGASKMSVHSYVSKRTESNTTLKQLKGATESTKSLSKEPSLGSRKDAGDVRKRRSSSKTSIKSHVSNVSQAVSSKSNQASKMSVHSYVSKRTESNTTLKQLKETTESTKSLSKRPSLDSRKDAGAHRSSRSRVSLKSQFKQQADDNVSRITHKSLASVHQADKISIKSKVTDLQAEKISITSKAKDFQADNISRKTIKSIASDVQADQVSQISRISSKANDIQSDGKSNVSIKSQTQAQEENKKPLLKELAESVKKELETSMETSKSLAEKAALISDRLRAGNVFKHNRFHSLTRMYTNTEPVKRCRQDRMTFWFKDAVLS